MFSKMYLKEWTRENGAARLVQMMLLFVIPSITFFFNAILPAISSGDRRIMIYSGSLMLLSVSFIYSAIYRMEIEEKVLEGFPIDYLPVSKEKLFFTQTLFSAAILTLSTLAGFLASILLLDTVKMQGVQLFSKDAVFSFAWPFFAGIPYVVLFGVILGGIFGTVGKKIVDNFPYSARKYVVIFYMAALFFAFRPYVSSLLYRIGAQLYTDNLLRFSPVEFSSFPANLMSGVFSLLNGLLSLSALAVFSFLFFAANRAELRFLPDITPQNTSAASFSFISPLWNLVLRRWFSPFAASLLILWILSSIAGALISNPVFKFLSVLLIYVYTFLAIDRMFPSKDENYISVWQSLPVSRSHMMGVSLGAYYIFYMIPLFIAYSLLDPSGSFASALSAIPNTVNGFLMKLFPFLTISALIPAAIFFNPNLWSENDSGSITRKKTIIFYLLFGYTLFSSASTAGMLYISAPGARLFIESLFGGNGRTVLKTLFYSVLMLSVLLHSSSLYLVVRSFFRQDSLLTEKK